MINMVKGKDQECTMVDHVMQPLGTRFLDEAQQQGRFSRQPTQFYITKIEEVVFCTGNQAFIAVQLTSPGTRFNVDFHIRI